MALRKSEVAEPLRDELSSGQHRLTELEEKFGKDKTGTRVLQLARGGEVEIFPVGAHVIVRLSSDD